jgi:hypothetical protein
MGIGGWWPDQGIRRIEIVLTGDSYQGKQGIAAGVGEGRSHPMRRIGIPDGAYRPLRGHPFAGGMDQQGGEKDLVRLTSGCLNDGDLVLAQGLADDVEAASQRRIAKRPVGLSREGGADGGGQGLFRVGQLGLGPGEGGGKFADLFTATVHRYRPLVAVQS